VFFLLLMALVMLRHESLGNDTVNYINHFKSFSKMSWYQVGRYSTEFGFSYYNKIVSLFTSDPQVYLAVTAVLTTAMIYPTYRRLCEDSSLTIVLFCLMSTFVMMFSGIRQMLAVGIGVVAYEFTRRKKLISFVLAVLLAMSFHTSAFMLAFMYPLYYAKITKKWLPVVVPSLAVAFVFNRQIFTFLNSIISRFTRFDGEVSSTGAFTMLILFVAFAVFAFLIPEEAELDQETIALRNFLLMAVVLQMFAPLHTWAMRLNYYYIIFIPLLIPKIISRRSVKWDQVAIWGRHIMVAFFLVYFFFNAYTSTSNLNVFPYRFFWESL